MKNNYKKKLKHFNKIRKVINFNNKSLLKKKLNKPIKRKKCRYRKDYNNCH